MEEYIMKQQSLFRITMPRRMMALILVFAMLFQSTAYAYTVYIGEGNGATSFSTTKKNFKNAKSPMYTKKSQTIEGKITEKYYQDMYHYECQEGGYYSFYTTGKTDTVGALFEEQNFLMYLSYDRVSDGDDRFIVGDKNFGIVADLDKYEDYYILVRGYGSNTGKYTLNIEPNEDKVFHTKSGVWKCDKMPNSAAALKIWTSKKVYLTKEQTVLYYNMLTPGQTISNGKISYNLSQMQALYNKDKTTATNFAITAVSSLIGVATKSKVVSLSASFLGFLLSEAVSNSSSESKALTIQKKIRNACGLRPNFNASTQVTTYPILKGLCAKQYFNTNSYVWEYLGVSEQDIIKGEKWYVGKWTF